MASAAGIKGAMVADTAVLRMNSANLAREWAKAQDSVQAFIGSLVTHFSETEDLLQETAVRTFAQAERYDPSRPFLPWAIGIAQHVVLEHRRKVARDRHVFDQQVVEGLAEVFARGAEQAEPAYRALANCRQKLSSRSNFVLRLRYENNLAPTQIAAQTGSTPGMVRVLLHRVRRQLRACIERRLRAEGRRS